jgi:hypothetical protein
MKASDRGILLGIGVLALAVAFYLLVLAPKRQEAGELADEISTLEDSISEQEQVAAFAEEARQQFPTYYGRLVVLGKAVPDQADTSSLLVQLNSIANRSSVEFRGITLSEGGAGGGTSESTAAVAPPAAAAGTTGDSAAEGESDSTEGSTETTSGETGAAAPAGAAPTATPATEATAATVPIGAVVGPAGLPTLPYELTFKGGFFNIADYIGGLDGLVKLRKGSGQVAADGRLMTVDGFALKGGKPGGDPELEASFLVTAYVTPAEQGLTAGATPGGPAPVNPAQPQTTPASGTVTP